MNIDQKKVEMVNAGRSAKTRKKQVKYSHNLFAEETSI